MNFYPWHFTSSLLPRDEAGRVSHPRATSSFLPHSEFSSDPPILSQSCSSKFHYAHLVVVSKFCPRGAFPEVQPGPGLPKREPERRAPNRLKNSWAELAEVQTAKNTLSVSSASSLRLRRGRGRAARRHLPFFGPSSKKRKADFPDAEH